MRRGYLVSESNPQDKRRVPIGSRMVVGRASDCTFVIDDAAASRWHLEIVPEDDTYRWKDLGSTNGTLHNGLQKLGGELREGDLFQIGETVLTFRLEEVAEDQPGAEDTTVFKETIVDWNRRVSPVRGQAKPGDLLRAVYAIANEIASNYEPCSLVDRILETTMGAIDAQRGAILFAGRSGGDLAPCPVCDKFHVIQDGKTYHIERGDTRISKTVAARVLSRGESVLFQDSDADADGEVAYAASVLSLELRSIICVPLRGKYGILGLLYMDSTRADHPYTHEDMLLATAVGNSAGLALENATMHRQILEKRRMEQEIEYAWQIQKGFLLTDWPDTDKRFTVYGETRPAKTVGGDFYDFVMPQPNVVGILIGDVSGKGVPAALTMAQLLTEFRVAARQAPSPVAVIQTLNDKLYLWSQRGMFCTLCYLTLDLATGRVCCANAGHHPAVSLSNDELRLFGHASGPPVGVVADGRWSPEEAVLKPGETALLYTDGIVEARAPRGQADPARPPQEFDMENLCALLNEIKDRSPRELIDAVNDRVLAFCKPALPHDDCTMIAVRYKGIE